MRLGRRPWLTATVAGACVLSAVAGGMQAAANVLALRAPQTAVDLSGSSPLALETLTRIVLSSQDNAEDIGSLDLSPARPLARETLSRTLLSPMALAVLAWELPGERRASVLDAAARVSRRDAFLQGLLAQHYVQRDEMARALEAMNATMLVHPQTRPNFVSVMTPLLAREELIPAFEALLGDSPPWGPLFFQAAANEPALVPNLVRLRLSLPETADVPAEIDQRLILRYANAVGYSQARQVYLRLRGEAASPVQQGAIDWRDEFPPFDWRLVDGFDAYARVRNEGGLSIRVRPGHGGTLAERIVYPTDGATRLTIVHDVETGDRESEINATISCADSGDVLAEQSFARSPITLDFGARGSGCEAIRIAISGRAWSTGETIEGPVESIRFD